MPKVANSPQPGVSLPTGKAGELNKLFKAGDVVSRELIERVLLYAASCRDRDGDEVNSPLQWDVVRHLGVLAVVLRDVYPALADDVRLDLEANRCEALLERLGPLVRTLGDQFEIVELSAANYSRLKAVMEVMLPIAEVDDQGDVEVTPWREADQALLQALEIFRVRFFNPVSEGALSKVNVERVAVEMQGNKAPEGAEARFLAQLVCAAEEKRGSLINLLRGKIALVGINAGSMRSQSDLAITPLKPAGGLNLASGGSAAKRRELEELKKVAAALEESLRQAEQEEQDQELKDAIEASLKEKAEMDAIQQEIDALKRQHLALQSRAKPTSGRALAFDLPVRSDRVASGRGGAQLMTGQRVAAASGPSALSSNLNAGRAAIGDSLTVGGGRRVAAAFGPSAPSDIHLAGTYADAGHESDGEGSEGDPDDDLESVSSFASSQMSTVSLRDMVSRAREENAFGGGRVRPEAEYFDQSGKLFDAPRPVINFVDMGPLDRDPQLRLLHANLCMRLLDALKFGTSRMGARFLGDCVAGSVVPWGTPIGMYFMRFLPGGLGLKVQPYALDSSAKGAVGFTVSQSCPETLHPSSPKQMSEFLDQMLGLARTHPIGEVARVVSLGIEAFRVTVSKIANSLTGMRDGKGRHVTNYATLLVFVYWAWNTAFVLGDYGLLSDTLALNLAWDHSFLPLASCSSSDPARTTLGQSFKFLGYFCAVHPDTPGPPDSHCHACWRKRSKAGEKQGSAPNSARDAPQDVKKKAQESETAYAAWAATAAGIGAQGKPKPRSAFYAAMPQHQPERRVAADPNSAWSYQAIVNPPAAKNTKALVGGPGAGQTLGDYIESIDQSTIAAPLARSQVERAVI